MEWNAGVEMGDSGVCDSESGIYVVWSDHVGVEGAESAKVD